MSLVIWIIIIAIHLLAFPLILWAWLLRNNKTKKLKLPPGPKGFPIFGSLHLLGKLPHRDLHFLSLKYGPIMHIKLGLVSTIVVSSPQAAELFLKTHDLDFANRTPNEVLKHMSFGQKSMVVAKYGSYLRNMRKMCTLDLLSSNKLNSFKAMRREEVGLLVEELREASRNEVVVNLATKLSSLTANMICLMVFGKKYEDKELDERGFKWMVQEAFKVVGAFNLGDFIPFIAPLDVQGFIRRAKSIHQVFDRFLERILNEHIESNNNNNDTKDFVDVMLGIMESQDQTNYQIDRSTIKAIMLDLLLAGMETSATTIGWALAELIRHPETMKKVQQEIEKNVGLNRMVQETDLGDLKYLEMVVKEVFRLHPPGPLFLPRQPIKDSIVNNFHIPKTSRIIVNVWAIGRDPSAWTNADKFFPERFMDSEIDVRGRDFELIPFGSGRRGCVGIQLGLLTIHFVLAQLLHCFNWKLPNGMLPHDLDMTEEFGLTCPLAHDVLATPIYRLRD